MAPDGQADKVIAFGREDYRFESSHRWPNSPLGSSLLNADPRLKTDVLYYFISKRIKKIKWLVQVLPFAAFYGL